MSKNTFLTLLVYLIIGGKAIAQSVTVEAIMDSMQLIIGEQTKIHLLVVTDSKQRAIFPFLNEGDTLVKGVEIVEISKPDTQYLNNNQRRLIGQDYTITSFDSALYYLPPFAVSVDSVKYKSKPLSLKVYSMPVDTLHPMVFFWQKTVMNPSFKWEDWYGLIICSCLALPLLLVLIYLVVRLRDNKPIIRKIKIEPKLPAHQLAMQEIERIKNEEVWQKGETKEYYTELTDAIRAYIAERFQFNALEMTSSEIIDRLLESNDENALKDLKELFWIADLVKFAKYNPQMDENNINLITAIQFVTQTRQSDEELTPQPTEMTVIEKRSLRSKILLVGFIVIISAAIVGTFVYIGIRLYDLF
ncbi:MAG: hypothetical protein LBV64_02575 [Mediterranea sp.]|nr:hypothetical protein [Mediterranea sp.]